MDDFCLTHGYEHMKKQFGNPVPYCEACDPQCFWDRCSDSARCKVFGSCVALHQRAHLADLPQTSKQEDAAKALVHRFEHESMALHRIQREWLVREIAALPSSSAPKLPEIRCDQCDNGIEKAWEFCAWCGCPLREPAP